jgi:hypothetical protein
VRRHITVYLEEKPMTERDAAAVHKADQAIGAFNAKVDGYLEMAGESLPVAGYEGTVADMTRVLVAAAQTHPEVVAAVAALAIVRLAHADERPR